MDREPLMENIQISEGNADIKDALLHPVITVFHLAFKISAVVVYLLCGWFSGGFVAPFVTIVILLSMDFWTVKNITGRMMVGLRWWNYVDEEGKSHWVFESRKVGQVPEQQNLIHPMESKIFWSSLILAPSLWLLFFMVCLFGFSFKWMVVVCIALSLSFANLYGYMRCRLGTANIKSGISSAASGFFRKQLLSNMMSMLTRQSNQPETSQPNSTPVQRVV